MCNTFRIHSISVEAIRLRLFSVTLCDRAKSWFQSLSADSITTWDELCRVFFSKFFLFEKTDCLHNGIHNFSQWDGKTLHKAWARFYYGLNSSTKILVNTVA